MRFTKMHGCGNDYVYVNGFTEVIAKEEKPGLARQLSHRITGIGGDGLIFINPSEKADFEMEMYNADGSRAEMCGNGIRCVAKYVYDNGLTNKEHITVESWGQVRKLALMVERQPGERGRVTSVRVDMGSPELEPSKIPVRVKGERAVNVPILVGGREFRMTCVSMGNPHAVVFAENVRKLKLEELGPLFEFHDRFPRRVNTEFVEILDRQNCFMRVWERGSGETLACGTGCCAVLVAGVLNDLTESHITVKMTGGELDVEWDRERNLVYMTGPAVTVFEGEIVTEGERKCLS